MATVAGWRREIALEAFGSGVRIALSLALETTGSIRKVPKSKKMLAFGRSHQMLLPRGGNIAVGRQLLFPVDDNYFSLSTTITSFTN
jgi:hypothetical protein